MAVSLFACIGWSLEADTGDVVKRFARAAIAAVEEPRDGVALPARRARQRLVAPGVARRQRAGRIVPVSTRVPDEAGFPSAFCCVTVRVGKPVGGTPDQSVM